MRPKRCHHASGRRSTGVDQLLASSQPLDVRRHALPVPERLAELSARLLGQWPAARLVAVISSSRIVTGRLVIAFGTTNGRWGWIWYRCPLCERRAGRHGGAGDAAVSRSEAVCWVRPASLRGGRRVLSWSNAATASPLRLDNKCFRSLAFPQLS